MDREMIRQVLNGLIPGDSTEMDEATLGMLFPPGVEARVIDERTRTAAIRFARDHCCRFLFDGQSSKSTFLKLPGRWHELIDRLCTDLGRETPGTENFRINIDHEISEAEARASKSEAIPFGETPEQRKREFQEAKYYALVRTAIRRIKECGLKLYICSITLAFESQTISDRKTHRRDSGWRERKIELRFSPRSRFGRRKPYLPGRVCGGR